MVRYTTFGLVYSKRYLVVIQGFHRLESLSCNELVTTKKFGVSKQ